jgi:hypothetical protein
MMGSEISCSFQLTILRGLKMYKYSGFQLCPPALRCCGYYFCPEDGSSRFFGNIGNFVSHFKSVKPKNSGNIIVTAEIAPNIA